MKSLQTMHANLVENGPQTIFEYMLFGVLWPLSCLYGVVVRVRRLLYQLGVKKIYRASVPVISIGNLTAGGTGKTPMADYLVKRLLSKGMHCAIVSRGYGGSFRGAVGRVNAADGTLLMNPGSCGDEPYLLARRNPAVSVYVARRRADGVKQAVADGAEIVVLDDGFQHLAVARDINILLLDSKAPFGNEHLLPAGILREPIACIRYSDLIIMTRSDPEKKSAMQWGLPTIYSCHQPDKALATLDGEVVPEGAYVGKSCLAFAGIARPEEFFKSLRAFGFSHIEEVPLADHQDYDRETLNHLSGLCHNYDLLITTEKDAVKLSAVNFPKPCYQLGMELSFDDISPFADMFDNMVKHGK